MGLNLYQSGPIYAEMISYASKFPEGLFTGSPEKLQELRQAFDRAQERPLRSGRYSMIRRTVRVRFGLVAAFWRSALLVADRGRLLATPAADTLPDAADR